MSTKMLTLSGVLGVLLVAACVSSASAAPLRIEASVDTEYCASGGIQCTVAGTGHTAAAASNANHNPLRMFVQVVLDTGETIPNLVGAEFTFSNPFVPAGGGAAGLCSAATCTASTFQNGGNGLYSLFLDRVPAGNWRAGTYAGTVEVTAVRAGVTFRGHGLVTFTIPAAGGSDAAAEEPSGSLAGQVE